MAYLANETMRVGRGGAVVTLRPGDPVPEAAEWPWQVRSQYLANRRILEAPDVPTPAVTRKERQ